MLVVRKDDSRVNIYNLNYCPRKNGLRIIVGGKSDVLC